MKKKIVPKAPVSGMRITPHSGGENTQLKGFDGRDRVIASPTGGTVIAEALKRPGPHVPVEKPWTVTPSDHYEANSGPNFRSGPGIPKAKTWRRE